MNTTLPDDIDQLKALILAQQAVIVRLSGEITGYGREIATLTAQIAKLQGMLFGRSSEKNREKIEKKIAQAEKRITELQEKLGAVQSQLTTMAGDETARAPGRKALPATLPRDRKVIPPQETECPACHGKLTHWAKVSPNNSTSSTPRSGLSKRSGRSLRAASVTVSCRHRCRRNRSSAATPARACWPASSWRSSPNICRCTARRRSMPDRAWS